MSLLVSQEQKIFVLRACFGGKLLDSLIFESAGSLLLTFGKLVLLCTSGVFKRVVSLFCEKIVKTGEAVRKWLKSNKHNVNEFIMGILMVAIVLEKEEPLMFRS
jgi:hypothetical protein